MIEVVKMWRSGSVTYSHEGHEFIANPDGMILHGDWNTVYELANKGLIKRVDLGHATYGDTAYFIN